MIHTLVTQPYKPASQADSMPINENASCGNRLIDGTSRTQNRATVLLAALKSILCLLLSPNTLAIHNCQLSMHSRLPCAPAGVACTDVPGLKTEKCATFFRFSTARKTRPYLTPSCKVENTRNEVKCVTTLQDGVRYGTPRRLVVLLLAAALLPVVRVSGAEQVTRTALDTLVVLSGVARSPRSLFHPWLLPDCEVC
jgi:hypothetical protein